jgi:hypothetical protein
MTNLIIILIFWIFLIGGTFITVLCADLVRYLIDVIIRFEREGEIIDWKLNGIISLSIATLGIIIFLLSI